MLMVILKKPEAWFTVTAGSYVHVFTQVTETPPTSRTINSAPTTPYGVTPATNDMQTVSSGLRDVYGPSCV